MWPLAGRRARPSWAPRNHRRKSGAKHWRTSSVWSSSMRSAAAKSSPGWPARDRISIPTSSRCCARIFRPRRRAFSHATSSRMQASERAMRLPVWKREPASAPTGSRSRSGAVEPATCGSPGAPMGGSSPRSLSRFCTHTSHSIRPRALHPRGENPRSALASAHRPTARCRRDAGGGAVSRPRIRRRRADRPLV